MRTLGERLGIGIANALNTFDPDVVAVGGGVSRAGELLLGPATRSRGASRCRASASAPRSGWPATGGQAGVRGAALLAGLELVEEGTSPPCAAEAEPA